MSDYPFKVGDLVKVRSTITADVSFQKPGVIVSIDEDTGFFEILAEGVVRKVHRNYVVVPKVRRIKMTGGLK
tara:strand:- start:2050 stop:2265 length:216 start_codon:yes stop_codon:yes gene_type:complete